MSELSEELADAAWKYGMFSSRDRCAWWAQEFIIRLADQAYADASPDCPDDVGVYDAYDDGVEEMYQALLRLGA